MGDILHPTVEIMDLLTGDARRMFLSDLVAKARAAGDSESDVFVRFGDLARELYREEAAKAAQAGK